MRTAAAFALGLLLSSGQGIASEVDAERLRALGPDIASAFDAGDGAALSAIARDVERGEGGRTKNDAAALLLFEAACDLGDADGCSGLGFMHHRGRGVPRSFERAAALFEQACEAGSARGCSNLGFVTEWGQGVEVDYAATQQLYRRSCDADFSAGCANLGTVFEFGKGVPRDKDKAIAAYRQALALDPKQARALQGLKRLGATP